LLMRLGFILLFCGGLAISLFFNPPPVSPSLSREGEDLEKRGSAPLRRPF
jgi:hypothetical protein